MSQIPAPVQRLVGQRKYIIIIHSHEGCAVMLNCIKPPFNVMTFGSRREAEITAKYSADVNGFDYSITSYHPPNVRDHQAGPAMNGEQK
jgi:hypothetical protein